MTTAIEYSSVAQDWVTKNMTKLDAIAEERGMEYALQAAYDAGNANALRWVPCSARLPEQRMPVLIVTHKSYRPIEVAYLDKSTWIEFDTGRPLAHTITAYWMPLPVSPEPYP